MKLPCKCRFTTCRRTEYHDQITLLSSCLLLILLHQQQQLILIMRVHTTTIRRLISSKKFYDIVKEKKERIIPKTAEEVIISKYLKENATYISNSTNEEVKKIAKTDIRNVPYQQLIRENPNGSIIEVDYKDTHIQMVSLNYQNVSLPDIYQLCQKANPDLVFVQARPEPYIKNFQLLPKTNGAFSDLKYFEQLCLTSKGIKSSILTQDLTQKLENMLGVSDKKPEKKVFINDNKDLVDDDVVMMASYYCNRKKKSLLFGQLPEQPWREWFCNSHTLMEIQQIFKHIIKNIPFYESLKLSPYRLGALLRPELFLNLRDRYIATIIEMAIASQNHKNILCFMGMAENRAVEQILKNGLLLRTQGNKETFTPIIEYLIGPEIKHSLLKDIQGWQIIQKHIIMDILHHGQSVAELPLNSFVTTNKIIDHYGIVLNNYPQETILQFRFDKTMQYLSLFKQQLAQGMQLKRKFMLREALRSSELQI